MQTHQQMITINLVFPAHGIILLNGTKLLIMDKDKTHVCNHCIFDTRAYACIYMWLCIIHTCFDHHSSDTLCLTISLITCSMTVLTQADGIKRKCIPLQFLAELWALRSRCSSVSFSGLNAILIYYQEVSASSGVARPGPAVGGTALSDVGCFQVTSCPPKIYLYAHNALNCV